MIQFKLFHSITLIFASICLLIKGFILVPISMMILSMAIQLYHPENLRYKIQLMMANFKSNTTVFDNAGEPSMPRDFDVFICHRGSVKTSIAIPLHRLLTKFGCKPFLDCFDIPFTDDNVSYMASSIRRSKIILVIFSPDFCDSRWTMNELAYSIKLQKPILIMCHEIEIDDMPKDLKRYSMMKVTKGMGDGYWEDYILPVMKNLLPHFDLLSKKYSIKYEKDLWELCCKNYSKFKEVLHNTMRLKMHGDNWDQLFKQFIKRLNEWTNRRSVGLRSRDDSEIMPLWNNWVMVSSLYLEQNVTDHKEGPLRGYSTIAYWDGKEQITIRKENGGLTNPNTYEVKQIFVDDDDGLEERHGENRIYIELLRREFNKTIGWIEFILSKPICRLCQADTLLFIGQMYFNGIRILIKF